MTPGRAGPPLNLNSPCLSSPPPADPKLCWVTIDVLQTPPLAVLAHAALPVLFLHYWISVLAAAGRLRAPHVGNSPGITTRATMSGDATSVFFSFTHAQFSRGILVYQPTS